MNKEILQFILAFCAGIAWWRLLFLFAPSYFKKPLERSLLKLRWHHLHWGILMILVASVLILISGKNAPDIVLLGLGLGFCFDLFISSLLLETDREKEMIAYKKSLVPTLLFSLLIIMVVVILSLLF